MKTTAFALALALACGLAVHALPALAQSTGAPGVSYIYSDSDGRGCLTIATQGDDQTAGGTAISVTLTQNGVTFTGQGEQWLVTSNAPRTTALAFWLSDGNGSLLFLDGTLQMGVDTISGGGTLTSMVDPTVVDQWHAFHMVPPRPCAAT